MLGYVIGKPKKKDDTAAPAFEIPPDLRRRLHAWVDVDEVGPDGFWLWLRAVIPLLPSPATGRHGSIPPYAGRAEELRELQQRLVVYAREHARLNVIAEQSHRDNELLVRRLRALEAALRTLEMAGNKVVIPDDEDVEDVSERYLPTRRRRGDAPSAGG